MWGLRRGAWCGGGNAEMGGVSLELLGGKGGRVEGGGEVLF